MHWFLDPIMNQYADFSGRATRREYWMYTLIYILISLVIGIIIGLLTVLMPSEIFASMIVPLLFGVFAVGLLIPSIAITVRRLHDIGRSGWWLLLNFVPYVGGIIVVVLCCLPSQKGANKFGLNKYEMSVPQAMPQEAQPATAVGTVAE